MKTCNLKGTKIFLIIIAFLSFTGANSQWTTATLSVGREELAATSSDSKVFFAGGRLSGATFVRRVTWSLGFDINAMIKVSIVLLMLELLYSSEGCDGDLALFKLSGSFCIFSHHC